MAFCRVFVTRERSIRPSGLCVKVYLVYIPGASENELVAVLAVVACAVSPSGLEKIPPSCMCTEDCPVLPRRNERTESLACTCRSFFFNVSWPFTLPRVVFPRSEIFVGLLNAL